MTTELEVCVLDGGNEWSLTGSGCESLYRGPMNWICGWGLSMGLGKGKRSLQVTFSGYLRRGTRRKDERFESVWVSV